MNIIVFDTETINLEKPFCYNLGYVVADTETQEIILKRSFVIQQVWENKMLFNTAYYEDKKDIYVGALRSRKSVIKYWGHACQRMIKDIEDNNVEIMYAFNSPFDIKVFDFMCDWFKNANPCDYVKVIDIRALISPLVFSQEYKDFCNLNGLFTESGNYLGTAESITQFIRTKDFKEDHTALSDSIIECEILWFLINNYNVDITKEKTIYRTIPTNIEKEMKINHNGVNYNFPYVKKYTRNGIINLKSKDFIESSKKKEKIEIQE